MDIQCQSTGTPPVRYTWERIGADLSIHAQVYDGRLRFRNISRSDEGEYRCAAVNGYGDDSQILRIYVRDDESNSVTEQEPTQSAQVYITPTTITGRPGDEVRLQCTTQRDGTVVWSKAGHFVLPHNVYVNRGVLVISSSSPEDSGLYQCVASAPNRLPSTATANVHIVPETESRPERPVLQPLQEQYTVFQGDNFQLDCQCSSNAIVKWTKLREEFETNVYQTGHTLHITKAVISNRGIYICVADSEFGNNQVETFIEIERKLSYKSNLYMFFKVFDCF